MNENKIRVKQRIIKLSFFSKEENDVKIKNIINATIVKRETIY